jgi:YD repeat-containing protein
MSNYEDIDWSDGKPFQGSYGPPAESRVKGIPAIRSDKPHVSEAAAVHADQVREFNKQAARGTHYDGAGRLVSESDAARRRELRRRGMADGWM